MEAISFDTAASPLRHGLKGGRYAHLSVTDNGCGMSSKIQKRIDGQIEVESEIGKGTTFHVYLSMAMHDADRLVKPAVLPTQVDGQGRHVLCVDDDEVTLLMMQRLLEHHGFKVTAVDRATDAIAKIRSGAVHFDLLVTDHDMPEMSGLDLARCAHAVRPDLAVVLSSGFVSDELLSAARLCGVREVVAKESAYKDLPVKAALLTGVGRER